MSTGLLYLSERVITYCLIMYTSILSPLYYKVIENRIIHVAPIVSSTAHHKILNSLGKIIVELLIHIMA